jgi:hypothetical protein
MGAKDFTSEKGAKELCSRIVEYWKNQGFSKVMAAPVPLNTVARWSDNWGIKSNIGLNGPPA